MYRDKLVQNWLTKLEELGIPISQKYSLEQALGNPLEIREWTGNGLPSDSVSINNGILVSNCRSYPLLIDPQLQASKWIKRMYNSSGLKVIRMAADGLLKTLEACLRMGSPLLLEDVGEAIEPALEPILAL